MAVRGESEFLNLPFQEKLEFLYGLPARQKRDLILSAPEAERLVQSFSPETLFYTLKEIGSADAGDLLSLAMPEQVKSLFDLDCWNRDRPNVHRMREWIEAMADGGRRKLADALMGLDMEMMSLLLRGYIKVHRIDEPAPSPDAAAKPLPGVLSGRDRESLRAVRRKLFDRVHPARRNLAAHLGLHRRSVRARLQLLRRADGGNLLGRRSRARGRGLPVPARALERPRLSRFLRGAKRVRVPQARAVSQASRGI